LPMLQWPLGHCIASATALGYYNAPVSRQLAATLVLQMQQ